MSLNDKKNALLAFPLSSLVRIALIYGQDFIPQVDSLKYTIHCKYYCSSHIRYIASKGLRAIGLLKRISNG